MTNETEQWLDSTLRYIRAAFLSGSADEKRHAALLAHSLSEMLAHTAAPAPEVLPAQRNGGGRSPQELQGLILQALVQRFLGGAGGAARFPFAFGG
jgi:hypothetical protein